MSTVAQIAGDRQYIVGVASTYTKYYNYLLAQAAAATLSAGNGNAAVYTGQVLETVTAGTAPVVGRVDLQAQAWIVQLASTATLIPLDAATNNAFATSASNANAPVLVARAFQTVTGP